MKKLKNMNIDEIKQACEKALDKRPIHDTFDLQGLQLAEYMTLLNNQYQSNDDNGLMNTISDIYNHGFVAGTKQKNHDIKAVTDKQLRGDSHRELVELVYNLPLGVTAPYFYTFMCFYLREEGIMNWLPKRISNKANQFMEQLNEDAEEQDETQEQQLTEEEKAHRKAISDAYYRLTSQIMQIDDLETLDLLYRMTLNCTDSSQNAKNKLAVIKEIENITDWNSINILYDTVCVFSKS